MKVRFVVEIEFDESESDTDELEDFLNGALLAGTHYGDISVKLISEDSASMDGEVFPVNPKDLIRKTPRSQQ